MIRRKMIKITTIGGNLPSELEINEGILKFRKSSHEFFVGEYKEKQMAEAKKKEEKKVVKSWKTTIAGIAIGIGIIITIITPLIDGKPETVFSFSEAWPQILVALGSMGVGIFARDNDKSSEDVGTKSE